MDCRWYVVLYSSQSSKEIMDRSAVRRKIFGILVGRRCTDERVDPLCPELGPSIQAIECQPVQSSRLRW